MEPRRQSFPYSSMLLVLVALATLTQQFVPHLVGGSVTAGMAALALSLFFLLQWVKLAFIARFLIGLSFLVLIGLYSLGDLSREQFNIAVHRGAFLAFFVTAVNMLRDAAETSPLIRRCGEMIVNQPPGRRYLVLTLGGNLFGVFLSIGCVNLLTTMVYRSVDEAKGSGDAAQDAHIRLVRLRRMTNAIMRGFCAIPLWAPTSVTIAILLARLDDVSWLDILPAGLVAAFLYLAVGWAMDRLSYKPAPVGLPVERFEGRDILMRFSQLLGLVALIPALGFMVADWFDLRLIMGLLVCMPIVGICWIFLQYRPHGTANMVRFSLKRLVGHTLPGLAMLRSEVTIFACSGFLALLLLPNIDVDGLGRFIASYDLSAGMVMVITSWLVTLLALVGLNPIFTVTLAVEVLPIIPGLVLDSGLMVLMFTVTWAAVVCIAPISTSVRLAAVCIRRPPNEVGLVWNGPFALIILMSLSVFLFWVAP